MYEYAVLFTFLATRYFPQNFERFVRRALVALALRTDAATHKPSLLFDEIFQMSVHSHFLTSYAFTRNPCAFFLRFIGWLELQSLFEKLPKSRRVRAMLENQHLRRLLLTIDQSAAAVREQVVRNAMSM